MTRKQRIIDKALDQIKQDVRDQDMTAIEELLTFCPLKNIIGYLSEFEYINQTEREKERKKAI